MEVSPESTKPNALQRQAHCKPGSQLSLLDHRQRDGIKLHLWKWLKKPRHTEIISFASVFQRNYLMYTLSRQAFSNYLSWPKTLVTQHEKSSLREFIFQYVWRSESSSETQIIFTILKIFLTQWKIIIHDIKIMQNTNFGIHKQRFPWNTV
jgi:hypothetical protein